MQINNRGIEILKKYQPEAEINVGHDQIYIGEHNPKAMTQEERNWMEEDGWFEDEESDSWSHFV